jgi:hypothetical protein
MNKVVKSALLAAVVGAGMALSALPAAADVVCNREGECWHVKGHYEYRHEFGIVVHPDNWRWGPREHYTWHEHEGRGYWRHGVWVVF